MDHRLSPDEIVYRLCDEALFYLWDPIGVNDSPEARDEYESYVPRVAGFVTAGDREGLVDFLTHVMGESMGLTPDSAAAARAADFMIRGEQWVVDRYKPLAP